MRPAVLFLAGLLCGGVLAMVPAVSAHLRLAAHALHGRPATQGRARRETAFSFNANASLEQVAPLFGADKERAWAPEWAPRFVHPLPAADSPGMVFTVAHGPIDVPWVNTEFDLKNGRVQYAYVIPETLVTVITLKLTPLGKQTRVDVEYDRTALTADGDAHVQRLARHDAQAGPVWQKQINDYLAKQNASSAQ